MNVESKETPKRGVWHGLVFGAGFVLLGIFAIIVPEGPLSFIIAGIALLLSVNGFLTTIASVKNKKTNIFWKKGLFSGLIQLSFGLILFFRSVEVSNKAITVIITIVGIFFIITGVSIFILFIKKRNQLDNFSAYIARSVLIFIIGIVLLLKPLGFGYLMLRLVAFFAIIFGVIQIILSLKLLLSGAKE